MTKYVGPATTSNVSVNVLIFIVCIYLMVLVSILYMVVKNNVENKYNLADYLVEYRSPNGDTKVLYAMDIIEAESGFLKIVGEHKILFISQENVEVHILRR